jgi:Protein of unknown function (DUF2950)
LDGSIKTGYRYRTPRLRLLLAYQISLPRLNESPASASFKPLKSGAALPPRTLIWIKHRDPSRSSPNRVRTLHGGALDYIVNGKMIGGFGLVANPAEYRNSGVMTFIVNHEGVVFQKDLGPRIAELAERMTAFNPDSSWTKVSDTELALSPAVRQSCRPRFRASSTDH